MDFYENYVRLCTNKGITPSYAASKVGVDKSAAARWAKGSVPRYQTLCRIADYFGVTVGELVGATPENAEQLAAAYNVSAKLLMDKKQSETKSDNGELAEYLEDIRYRPEARMLLAATRGMTKEQVLAMAEFAEKISKGIL